MKFAKKVLATCLGIFLVASPLRALGYHEEDAVLNFVFPSCKDVRLLAPNGVLRFDGGQLTLPSDTRCEVTTVRVGRLCAHRSLDDLDTHPLPCVRVDSKLSFLSSRATSALPFPPGGDQG